MNKTNNWVTKYQGYFFFGGIIIIIVLSTLAIINNSNVIWYKEKSAAIITPTPIPTSTIIAGTFIEPEHFPQLDPININTIPIRHSFSLMPALTPFNLNPKPPNVGYQTYTVQAGDVPNSIAEQFGIEASTLLGGNPNLSDEANLLQTGQELIILPVDGVLHDVKRGDTLETLAEEYSVPVADIIAYQDNNLDFPYRLYENTQIMIPGAIREIFVWEPPTLVSNPQSGGSGYTIRPLIVGTGSFIWPVTGRRITQYYHAFHRGIDVALPEGNAVYASDTGTVVWAAWNNTGYGNLIVVDHGNGYQTYYAHLSGYNTYPGAIVYQGNVIGYTGNTGRSSGPHIHFEIRANSVQQNPFWSGYLSGG